MLTEQEMVSWFPDLPRDGFKVTSPCTNEYNCIAWAAGDVDVWWWPDAQNICYWPESVNRQETLECYVAAFQTLGYTQCSNSVHENGYEKIAIYVDSAGKPTHAARQLNNGYWTSKLGRSQDIEHKTLEGLHSQTYGAAVAFMIRALR